MDRITRVDQNKWRIASSETCWKVHEENPVAWQGFLRCDPRQEHSSVAQLPTGPQRRSVDGRQADVFLRFEVGSSGAGQSSSEVLSFRVVRVNWFQRSHHARSLLGIQREQAEFGYKCVLDVASDSQCVIGHSRFRGHSVASQWLRTPPPSEKHLRWYPSRDLL